MHYLVDGYNILFRGDEEGSLQERREQLTDRLIPASTTAHITLFWDAAFVEGGGRSHNKQLEIIYSEAGESADESIISYLEHATHSCTVVTGDRPLAARARRLGAQVLHGNPFLQLVTKWAAGVNQTPSIKKIQSEPTPHLDHYADIFEERLERQAGTKQRAKGAISTQSVLQQFASAWEAASIEKLVLLFKLPATVTIKDQANHLTNKQQLRRFIEGLLAEEKGIDQVVPRQVWHRKLSGKTHLVLVEWNRHSQRGVKLPVVEWLLHLHQGHEVLRIISISQG